MRTPLRVLIVEDSEDDVALLVHALRRGGKEPLVERVVTRDAMAAALARQPWDLVLADYSFPQFSARAALAEVQAHGLDLPFIVVSGTMGEDKAVAMMKAGAHDYLMKDKVQGLVPAIEREMRDAEVRRGHRQMDEARRDAHQRMAQVLTAIPSLVIGIDPDTTILWWNTTAEQMFGLQAAEVVGRSLQACGSPWDDQALLAALVACRTTGESVRVDNVRFQPPGRKAGFLGLSFTPMPRVAGGAVGVLLLGAEITERKLLQSQLVQTQRLESIGQLAAGIAHEINTPTQYVGDNTRFLQEAFGNLTTLLEQYAALLQASKTGRVPLALIHTVETTATAIDVAYLTEEIPRAIEQSLEGIERVATIVRAMKDFSHPGSEDKTVIDLNKAIESTITVARNEWKYVAEMVTDFAPALPGVLCLPGELNQVVLNLIVNAAHTIVDVVGHGSQEKGTITIRTCQESDWVEVSIADTGMGIPAAVRDKVFDPFFTTKEVGKGTGQGLAIAHDVVVRKHGGTITFDTVEGHGTTFRIRLPLGMSDV